MQLHDVMVPICVRACTRAPVRYYYYSPPLPAANRAARSSLT